MASRPVLTSRTDIPDGDYVSAGLSIVIPDTCFPNMMIGDKANNPWPYLRREVRHNWYCDRRAPQVGFLNRDEASLLYNLARPFQGKPALEVGTWMGWSTCHLALAGLALDVIDPILANPEHATSIRDSLAAAGVLGNVRLYATASPEGVRELAKLTGTKWNFFFIDGNHETPGPLRDAQECLEHAAQDAMIVFHDLTSPDVEEGLQILWRHGWQVLVYQTMQIVGVAWRGAVQPVAHQPDPSIIWSLPLHLTKYPVSGSSPSEDTRRLSQEIAWRDQEIGHLQEELTSTSEALAQARSVLAARDTQLGDLQVALGVHEDELACLKAQMETRETELLHLRTAVDELTRLRSVLTTRETELAAQKGELTRLAGQGRTQETELTHLRSVLTTRETELAAQKGELTRLAGQGRTQETELTHLRSVLTTRETELAAQKGELTRLAGQGRTQETELTRLRSVLTTRETELAAQKGELTRLAGQGRTQETELTRLRSVLTTRETELGRVHVEINARDGQINCLTLEATRLSREINHLSAEIERLQLTLDAVHRSASWKITRPLRAMKRGCRFLRRMPRRLTRVISRETESLPPDMARVLRIARATGTVAPRLSRRAFRSFRFLLSNQYRLRETVALIAGSGLFDTAFYLSQCPIVLGNGIESHYALHPPGRPRGMRSPSVVRHLVLLRNKPRCCTGRDKPAVALHREWRHRRT